MSRRASLGWWLQFIALLPVLLPQALHTRRTALRLPPAGGPQQGLAGAEWGGAPLRLLLLGESTVAGVGVEVQQVALSGQLAESLAQQLQRPVQWRALGVNGITAIEACEQLLPQASEAVDLALLVFGVNDTTHFSARRAWQRALSELAEHFVRQSAQVAFTAVPPIQHFTALPPLLRRVLGARARLLDGDLQQLAEAREHAYCALDLQFADEYLAADGYHPSARGYAVWAQALAARLEQAGAVTRR